MGRNVYSKIGNINHIIVSRFLGSLNEIHFI